MILQLSIFFFFFSEELLYWKERYKFKKMKGNKGEREGGLTICTLRDAEAASDRRCQCHSRASLLFRHGPCFLCKCNETVTDGNWNRIQDEKPYFHGFKMVRIKLWLIRSSLLLIWYGRSGKRDQVDENGK